MNYKIKIALGFWIALAGCNYEWMQFVRKSPKNPAESSSSEHTPNIQIILSQEPAGHSIWLAESPWGTNVTLILQELYTAASGRTCRKMRVQSFGPERPALACVSPNGNWEKVRLLQDEGWPVFDSSGQATMRKEINKN